LRRLGHGAVAVVRRYFDEDAGTLAAGIALYSISALPALIIAGVAIYGLVTDPRDVWPHIGWLARWLPPDVTTFLQDQLARAASATNGTLTITAAVGVVVALIGGENAVVSTIMSLNRIYGIPEDRTFLRRHGLSLAIAAGGFVLVLIAIGGLVALPAIADRLAWDARWDLLRVLRGPAAFLGLTAVLTIFYRLAPCRLAVRWRHALLGGAVAAIIGLGASLLLGWYATSVVGYGEVYGAAGGVLVILLWTYVMSIALMLGGLVSAEAARTPAARVAEIRQAAKDA
jgi:membrane protein